MSLSRGPGRNPEVRDIEADYREAYLAEYNSYVAAGNTEKAAQVADAINALNGEVKVPVGRKERVVPSDLEKAVEEDSPKRRGRPPKETVTSA